jgi:prepilin-type N-terminal cleavage/methylation domain-containing protein
MKLRERLQHQDGFTIVEVLVAALILVLGSLAVFQTLSASVHNVQRGKEAQAGISVAQRELEKLHSFSYEEIALKSTPLNESSGPSSRVSGTTFNLKRSGTAEYAPMVISATTGKVEPKTTGFSVGGTSVTIYRYVVWRKDTAYCATGTNSEKETCKTGQGFKRVIIDVVPSEPGNITYKRGYYELQSDFVNPSP